MDDGSFTGKIALNTQAFSLTENRLLQKALGRCFGFKVSINKDNRRSDDFVGVNRKTGALYYLHIRAESREDFFRIVSPYMHPIFEYKLPNERVFIGPRIRE